jgi:hypothetical protein
VLLQAQIAHDLLARRVRLDEAAASLWVLGFQVPFQIVRRAFEHQVSGYYRRVGARPGEDLIERLWQLSEWFARADARIRKGSVLDQEGQALLSLTGEALTLLFGVGDDDAEDTAAEFLTQIEVLKPITEKLRPESKLPTLQAECLEEAIAWIRNMLSVARQRKAVVEARDHDWVRARRIARLAIGTFVRGDAALAPRRHKTNLQLFARMAATYGRLLFPVLLAVTRDDEERRKIAETLFVVAARVRSGAPRAVLRKRR